MPASTPDITAAPIPFIDLKSQYQRLKPVVDARIQAVLDHGQYIMGPEVAELEQALAEYTGAQHAIGVSDGTTALLIAMMALQIKPGDEVITTPFTFWATGEMISLLGAVPVFVDIDPVTFNLDPSLVEAAITARTRAILPVSLYGQCADMDAINDIAGRNNLVVIEDAAQSFGATYRGRQSCNVSTVACTSFFPSKPLGCYGDGGACFTSDGTLAEKMRQIRVHGQTQRYRHELVGVNGRLDTLQAAVLLAKLPSFAGEVQARAEAGARYAALLSQAGIAAPVVSDGSTSVFAQYTVRVANRQQVADNMKALGVPTAVHYPMGLHQQPAYQQMTPRFELPQTELAASQVLSLPMYPAITPAIQGRVMDALVSALA